MSAPGTADSLPAAGQWPPWRTVDASSNGRQGQLPHEKPRPRAANQATSDLIQSRHPTATAGCEDPCQEDSKSGAPQHPSLGRLLEARELSNQIQAVYSYQRSKLQPSSRQPAYSQEQKAARKPHSPTPAESAVKRLAIS